MAEIITVGQFSESPVLLAARALGLLDDAGLDVRTERVRSSPAQFEALSGGELTLAITSPDNVLLYATTDQNPIGERLDLWLARPIDRGLGLTLVARPDLETADLLASAPVGVDVTRSGFALLLYRMLAHLGLDRDALDVQELGSTPRRLEALLAGDIGATILNAESQVRALAAGMRPWVSADDLYPGYLGTVLAVPAGGQGNSIEAFLLAWDRAVAWLLDAPAADVRAVLAEHSADLGSAEYLTLLRDPATGLVRDRQVDPADLTVLTSIRHASGAYTPDVDLLPGLVTR